MAAAAQGPDGPGPSEAASPCDEVLWTMRRNCALSPRQAALGMVLLSAPCVLIAAVFGFHGYWWIAPFAGVEVLAAGVAWLAYAGHAVDRESVILRGAALVVEHRSGQRVEHSELELGSVMVCRPAGRQALVELRGQGRRAVVGRYVRPELRPGLVETLRAILRHAGDRLAAAR